MKHLVTTDWLEKNLNNVRILDASWHLPNSNRNGLDEFKEVHIKNSNFFDIDKNSNQNSNFPHMLPKKNNWEKIVSDFGIKNSDHIIIYDNSDVISSCRVWYNFLYFNHNPNLISILDGGLKKWLLDKKETTKNIKKYKISSYIAEENLDLVLDKNQIISNIKNKSFELIDARSEERFLGLQPELRKELKNGNIEGSKNLPFLNLINIEDRTFKNKEELSSIFKNSRIDTTKKIAFTCGSGVTACILGLANSIVSGKKPIIYDGSWAEYGLKEK
jgi:thiosulfate/3-mercaptopyruvate sulfurtransferase